MFTCETAYLFENRIILSTRLIVFKNNLENFYLIIKHNIWVKFVFWFLVYVMKL